MRYYLLASILLTLIGCSSSNSDPAPEPLKPPTIQSFTASRQEVQFGQPSTLSWSLEGGAPTSITITSDGYQGKTETVTGTSLEVVPVNRQTFHITVKNSAGEDTKSLTLASIGVGPACSTDFKDGISGLEVDSKGIVYGVSGSNSGLLYKIENGNSSILVGDPDATKGQDGKGKDGHFLYPTDISLGPDGKLYIVDLHSVEEFPTLRVVDGDILSSIQLPGAPLSYRNGVHVTKNGNTYISFRDLKEVWCRTSQGAIYKVAKDVVVDDLVVNGDETKMWFVSSYGDLYPNPDGTLTAKSIGTVSEIDLSNGQVTLLAGSPGVTGNLDGPALQATFTYPGGLVFDSNRNCLFIASNRRIRKLDLLTMEVSTLAGSMSPEPAPGKNSGTPGSLQNVVLPLVSNLALTPENDLVISANFGLKVEGNSTTGLGIYLWKVTLPKEK